MNSQAKLPLNYQDRRISLRGYKIGVFEPGRELGALIPIVCRQPHKVSIQHRSIAQKIISIVSARDGLSTAIYLADVECNFIVDLLMLSFTQRFGKDVFCKTFHDSTHRPEVGGGILAELDRACGDGIQRYGGDFKPTAAIGSDGLAVVVVGPSQYTEMLEVLSLISSKRFICLICRDMSFADTKYPSPVLRQFGLRMLETADGYGEIWGFSA